MKKFILSAIAAAVIGFGLVTTSANAGIPANYGCIMNGICAPKGSVYGVLYTNNYGVWDSGMFYGWFTTWGTCLTASYTRGNTFSSPGYTVIQCNIIR